MTDSFSQRIGLQQGPKVAQLDGMDVDLRNTLWNALDFHVWESFHTGNYHTRDDWTKSNLLELIRELFFDFYKRPIDSAPRSWTKLRSEIRSYYFAAPWNNAYDFIEFVARSQHFVQRSGKRTEFLADVNKALERESSGFRFIALRLAPIVSSEEIVEVERAVSETKQFRGVQVHLKAALDHLADRSTPDYRNSIKESISAVESIALQLTRNKAGFADMLKALEREKSLHPALRAGFTAIFGYTSDEGGIRHAMLANSDVGQREARFMLVACSAFVNYLIASQVDEANQ